MGKIFLLGDDVDTDQLAPGQYMAGGIDALAEHCLETMMPDFAKTASAGDIIVAGKNFGVGSSREQAAEVLRYLKIVGVVALSFAGIFFRNAINLGLPVMVANNISGVVHGDEANLDVVNAKLYLTQTGQKIALEPLPQYLHQLLQDGGLIPHLKKQKLNAHKERVS